MQALISSKIIWVDIVLLCQKGSSFVKNDKPNFKKGTNTESITIFASIFMCLGSTADTPVPQEKWFSKYAQSMWSQKYSVYVVILGLYAGFDNQKFSA